MDINLNKSTLNRFSFLMSFHEHAYQLKQDGIIKRKIVAPDFQSEKTLKERLSRVMLKGLRSASVYDSGEELVSPDATVKIKSITRRLNRDFEIERYMQFVLELQSSVANDDIIPMEDGMYEMFYLEDEVARRNTALSLLPFSGTEQCERLRNGELVNYLLDNYVICAVKRQISKRDLRVNPLQGMLSPDQDNLMVSYRDCRFSAIQDRIFEVGTYYNSGNSPCHIPKLMHCMINGADPSASIVTCNYGNGKITTALRDGNKEAWDKVFTGNFYMPVGNNSYRASTEAGGTLMFCKKIMGNDGTYTIVPNLVESISRHDLVFSKESLLAPDTFYTLNKRLMSNIRTHILGDQDD
jgi:hypothetical protein